MNTYMLIQFSQLKVPLISYTKKYSITINDVPIQIDTFFERLCAFSIYTGYGKSRISELLKYNLKWMSAMQIEMFVQQFEKDHKVDKIEFTYDKIPYIAKEPDGFFEIRAGITRDKITVTYQQEQEMMSILTNEKIDRKKYIVMWWNSYCRNYAIVPRYKKDAGFVGETLADTFCQIHGVDIQRLPVADPENKESGLVKSIGTSIAYAMIIFIYLLIAVFVIVIGSYIDNFIISGIVMTIGFGMIGILLVKFFPK